MLVEIELKEIILKMKDYGYFGGWNKILALFT